MNVSFFLNLLHLGQGRLKRAALSSFCLQAGENKVYCQNLRKEVNDMKQLRGKPLVLVGFTLFSMFFGAGNLIFPPFLGAQAGAAAWPAMAGFAVSAIGFPVLGVVAVAKSGGLRTLAGRVHPAFAGVFTLLIYLSIGPGLAIPRTASTSFEMVAPFLPEQLAWGQALYSAVFFALAAAVALRPERLTDRLGKILCPVLILLIVVLFVGCIVHPVAGGYGSVGEAYRRLPVVTGFLGGYQTMDTIAALNFGAVIALNIRAKGISDDGQVVRGTIRAGWIAGGVLLVIYAMLAHVGALSGAAFPGSENGAETLSNLAMALFGPAGGILLAAIFFIACLNTCIGLLSCCSDYFHTILPRISYRGWVVLFAAVSAVISNIGLSGILRLSTPVLNAIYPPALVLILLSFAGRRLEKGGLVYPLTVGFVCVESVVAALFKAKITIPFVTAAIRAIPLGDIELGWVLPAVAGVALGLLLDGFCRKPRDAA